jgi:very-short-patch-repair endonuclease
MAERQQGVVSRAQALGSGLSSSSIDRLTTAGLWKAPYPGVYRLWRETTEAGRWQQDLSAGVLWLGAPCAISHRAAAALWELDGFRSLVVELSTTRNRQSRRPETCVHRVGSLPRADVCIRSRLPVTTVARTIIDLATMAAPEDVELAMESAIRRRLTSPARLETQLRRAPAAMKGREKLVALLAHMPATATESALETRIWRVLLNAGLPEPIRQFEVLDGLRLVARLDFAYPEAGLAIEADGYRFHSGRSDWRRDLTRRNVLTGLGWTILHATWEDVRQPGGDLCDRVWAILTSRSRRA